MTYIQQPGSSPPIGDGGDKYTGWDRFSRLVDQRWLVNSGADLERTQYGYDQASNRLWRANTVAEAASANQDEFYTYDGLYQLGQLQRGTLNGGKTGISGTPTWEEDFTFDPTGNWDNYLTKVSGSTTLNQDRTHNKDNALIAIDGWPTEAQVNAVGNMTMVPQPGSATHKYALEYDAWNRLMSVTQEISEGTSSSSSTSSQSSAAYEVIATFAYDGLSRRTVTSAAIHYYYTPQWQIIEQRNGSSTSADRQFVWGFRGPDDLVLRDTSSGSPTRLYAFTDYASVTAVVNTSGTVEERYGYNAFGKVRFMDGSFGSRTSSTYGWETLFDSYRWDFETGLYQVRYRYLHPTLGRWLTRDPLYEPAFQARALKGNSFDWLKDLFEAELPLWLHDPALRTLLTGEPDTENAAMGLYVFVANTPNNLVDSLGLQVNPRNPWGGYPEGGGPGMPSQGNCVRYAFGTPMNPPNQYGKTMPRVVYNNHQMSPPGFNPNNPDCTTMLNAFYQKGATAPDDSGNCLPGQHAVTVQVRQSGAPTREGTDVHISRQDPGGTWSDKPGFNPPRQINGPHDILPHYSECGTVCVPDGWNP